MLSSRSFACVGVLIVAASWLGSLTLTQSAAEPHPRTVTLHALSGLKGMDLKYCCHEDSQPCDALGQPAPWTTMCEAPCQCWSTGMACTVMVTIPGLSHWCTLVDTAEASQCTNGTAVSCYSYRVGACEMGPWTWNCMMGKCRCGNLGPLIDSSQSLTSCTYGSTPCSSLPGPG